MMTGTSGRAAFALGSSSRPLIPGMLMSDRIRMSDAVAGIADALKRRRARDCANSMVKRPARRSRRNCWRNKIFDIGLVVDYENEQIHALFSCFGDGRRRRAAARSVNSVNSPGSRIDLDRTGMLLDDDVVTERKAEPGAFAGRLGGEERIEHLFLHFGRNAGAVVADPDFDAVAEVFGRGGKRRLVVAAVGFALCAWSPHKSRWKSG